MDKFYNANKNACILNSITIETNAICILPLHQSSSLETVLTKQKPILEKNFFIESEEILSLFNTDTWYELKPKTQHYS